MSQQDKKVRNSWLLSKLTKYPQLTNRKLSEAEHRTDISNKIEETMP